MKDNSALIGALAYWLKAGKLEAGLVLPAVTVLAGENAAPASLLAVYEGLETETDESIRALARHVRATLQQEAFRCHQKRKQGLNLSETDLAQFQGLPPFAAAEWAIESSPTATVENAVLLTCDLACLAARQEKAPELFHRLSNQTFAAMSAAYAVLAPTLVAPSPVLLRQMEMVWTENLPGRDRVLAALQQRATEAKSIGLKNAGYLIRNPPVLPEDDFYEALGQAFNATDSREDRTWLLSCACSAVTPAVIPTLRRMTAEAWAQDRAMLLLILRFGQPNLKNWADWQGWLAQQAGLWRSAEESLSVLLEKHALGLLLILSSSLPDPDPGVLDDLVKRVGAAEPPVEISGLLEAWSKWTSINEKNALLDLPEPAAPPIITPPPVIPEIPAEPPPPPKPSLWEKHLQPFFVENWYIVAGIAMVILGSSLLAYYTWDKHWLLRYTIMPSLLALFTWSLAGVGRWIEKRSEEFKGTAAMLRGAAIGLLPINFMTMALLSGDEKVSEKGPALLVMSLIYLVVFGWGLRSWCAAVWPSLGNILGGTLLLLNSLVAVGPLARTVGHLDGQPLLLCLGAGFYVGFIVMTAAIVFFARKILTREMAEEKRVPWFVASALAITYLQVFVWVHGYMRHVPQAHTYAILVIMIGWLVLYVERRALQLRESSQLHGGESFLGFAFILLGLLMGFAQPAIRIVAFIAAGAVWMYQALGRRHALHYWISLTLLALGGAAIGLLPSYPAELLPMLGLLLAVGFGVANSFSLKCGREDLAEVCRGMQVATLFVTTMVAPLAQWHFNLAPWTTAGWLLAIAAMFAWRALKDQKIHWLHATALILALVLPYAGFMDMAHHTAHHNAMVFGTALLACLWLIVTRLRPTPLILQARSTILWFYGILGLAGMLLRVLLGDASPNALWYHDYMDYLGPILMTLVLVPATYYSRSLIPAGMAVAIMAILFPELRANLQSSIPWLSWGSGLGSADCAFALAWLCFYLRRAPFLKNLPDGDRFMGKEPFPLQRFDHTLFTWPMLAAVVFLIVKVEIWNVLHNYFHGGVRLKTAIALCVTGVTWTLLGVYGRERRGAVVAIHLSWIWSSVGIFFGYWKLASDPYWAWPFLLTGLMVQGRYWIYRYLFEPKRPWAHALLTVTMRNVLLVGSGVMSVITIAALFVGASLGRMQYWYYFLAAQLIWHALAARRQVMGVVFFFLGLTGLLAFTAPGAEILFERLSFAHSLTPLLGLLLGIQLVLLAFEHARVLQVKLSPLLHPAFALGSAFALILAFVGLADGLHWQAFSPLQQTLLLLTILLTARAQRCGLLLLLASLMGYLMLHRNLLMSLDSLESQIELLVTPWRLALLGLSLALIPQAARWLKKQKTALIVGPYAQSFFTTPSSAWIFAPAVIISVVGAFYHTFHPMLRESPVQLWSPYTGAMTLALVAWFWPRTRLFAMSGFLLMMGNIHLIRVFAGDFLRAHGLAETHLVCLGLSLTLLQSSIFRRVIRPPSAIARINLASLGLGGIVLVLLSASYFTDPNLASISSLRFIISGAMAWLAGQYFRRAARHPGPGEEAHTNLCEALYHFGVVMALWCAVLLIPWFRNPAFALIALSLPVAYFYLRAELGLRHAKAAAERYRNSAAVLGLVVLGLYFFKSIFHLVLFPEIPISTQYYHDNAPIIIVLGLVLLRLRGLGGSLWLAFYGGLSLMGGSYFLLTAFPELSPFHFPMAGAWCALALGHFWILVSHARSPLRTLIQRLARLTEESWQELRQWWGWCLLAATQGAVIWGLLDYQSNTYMVAPLLLGAATILIHQGIIRQLAAKNSLLYFLTAAVQLAFALHLDFFIPSYLPKDDIIWALLGLWLLLLVSSRKLMPETVARIALVFAAFVFTHVLYHQPWSDTGLWAVALGAILAALNPQSNRESFRATGQLLLVVPIWLVYFSQAPIAEQGIQGALRAWPVLAATTMLFLTGLFARLFPIYLSSGYRRLTRSRFCLFDSTLTGLETSGPLLHRVTLWITFTVITLLQTLHYHIAFTPPEFALAALLSAALAVAWYYEGRQRESMLAYYMLQFSAAACCAIIRRHLMLTCGSWNYEYDVWASLCFSFALAGAKQILRLRPRAVRVPVLTSMFVLPVTALIWVMVHGLGVDMALLIVGLQSVLFAYLGKDDRESPYNIVALAGFVAFILVAFYSKLHLRAIHAYIIPVGLGILVLQEIFRARIKPESSNWIRLLTLMAMLGSSAYYALADASHPITFNLTMVVLCLLAMGLGSFLKIRMYLALGFAGLMVDLISILYKVLVLMERNSRMTIIGILVLIIGAVLVFGAIYYKTNKAKFDALIDQWRGNLAQWR